MKSCMQTTDSPTLELAIDLIRRQSVTPDDAGGGRRTRHGAALLAYHHRHRPPLPPHIPITITINNIFTHHIP